MSANDVIKLDGEEDNKSSDKKQIEEEEREVMLKVEAENVQVNDEQKLSENEGPVKAALSGTVTEEGREVKPKFIPIGAIKMPGFFTRNSEKDKNKEECTADNGDKEGTEAKPKRSRFQFLHTCPFTQFLHHPRNLESSSNDNPEGNSLKLVDRIRVPLSNMLKRNAGKDPEAALASMETLEDKPDTNNDEMENVKLGGDEPDVAKVATNLPLKERLRQRKFIVDDIVVCVLVLIVLLAVTIGVIVGLYAGPPMERPLRAGKYMTTLTGCGPVEGVLNEGVYNFYGIPYAVPPVGDKRFTYAQSLNNLTFCWNDTLQVHKPKPLCLQSLENRTIIGEEDCLTLDIVTPSVSFHSPLPVVVLIGANSLAGGISPLQPSAMYSRTKEIVFVKPNFRLGALGFLSLDILSNDKYPPTSGNYGLSDLLVALEWIKLNIKYFGGDPKTVTLFGHRAGATLTAALTTVKKAKKLYSKVWLSSPSVIYPGESLEQDQKKNEQFKDISKCTDAACLRHISPVEILSATPDIWMGDTITTLPLSGEFKRTWLVLDGDLLRAHPYETWDERDYKPMVFGTTQHSAHADILKLRHVNWTAENVEAAINNSVIGEKGLTNEVYNHYNKTYKGLVELTSAIRTVCPLVSLARLRLAAPLYLVLGEGAGAGLAGSGLAGINADVEAILGTFDSDTPEQRRYMSAMQQLFYYFVWHGQLLGPESGSIAVGQDLLPQPGMAACDMFIKEDIVPRYAHID